MQPNNNDNIAYNIPVSLNIINCIVQSIKFIIENDVVCLCISIYWNRQYANTALINNSADKNLYPNVPVTPGSSIIKTTHTMPKGTA